MAKLYLKGIKYDKALSSTEFPFNLPIAAHIEQLIFETPVTFLIGENGSGKSTIIETMAGLMGLNLEGGSKNNIFTSYKEQPSFVEATRPIKYPDHPKDSYFYRAESFYNLMTEIETIDQGAGFFERSLHTYSRGESFYELVATRFLGRGFYLLDEPETGLSLSTQLQLMVLMQDLVQRDSQFVIATHSPILLFFPKATIYEFMNGDIVKRKLEETKIYQDWAMIFERKEHFFQKLFES
ncbi:hypothetical protein A5819_002758 [Enterococcus sp. 7E2_DIV0204]|uniref:AAA family ATPase n=1 Tax=unclassified Enterococcus TaxID=2608891 RepID=UPI000A34023D|nr:MULTISPECIES: AAA family ATPase [unclassified Enterococcus]OTN90259.1 hypothetical protein A5819_002758 [Enterococcus sp. 7E2_DIV0204]OTP52715.1 hypothetical protein A5884_001917 [Enterococcus sp. 7D2_DIV0200]